MRLTRSSNQRDVKRFAGWAAAGLIAAFLAASAALLQPAPVQAASSKCVGPVSLKGIHDVFPDARSYSGGSLERLMGPIAAELGVNPGLDYSAVTSIEVQEQPHGVFLWFVEDGQRACYGLTHVSPEKWDAVVKAAFGIGV